MPKVEVVGCVEPNKPPPVPPRPLPRVVPKPPVVPVVPVDPNKPPLVVPVVVPNVEPLFKPPPNGEPVVFVDVSVVGCCVEVEPKPPPPNIPPV